MRLCSIASVAVLILGSACTHSSAVLSTPEAIAQLLQDEGLGCDDFETGIGPILEGGEASVCSVRGEYVTIYTVDRDKEWRYTPSADDPTPGPVIYQVFDKRWMVATESQEAATAVHEVLGGTFRST